MLTCHRTTEEEKYRICEWKYDGEYAIYNCPPYEEQKEKQRGLANPANQFFSFCEDEELVGYINLRDEGDSIFFGIAVRPDCCNQGYGQKITKSAIALSRRLYGEKPLSLKVRTWNIRAIRCYARAGFRIAGEPVTVMTDAGEAVFIRMVSD